MKRRYLVFIGGIAVIQFFYLIWVIEFEESLFQGIHHASLEIFKAGAPKQNGHTCSLTENTQIVPDKLPSFNQTAQILHE